LHRLLLVRVCRRYGATRGLRHAVAVACSPKPFRYCCHPFGIRGVARWMKSTDAGGRGFARSVIETSSGSRLPLRMLHGAHEVTTFSQTESPPRLRGTTWSSLSLPPLVPLHTQKSSNESAGHGTLDGLRLFG